MDISSALKVLRNSTTEALGSHHQEILLTLTEIGQRLKPVTLSVIQDEQTLVGSEYSASIPNDSDQSSYGGVSESESSVESHRETLASDRPTTLGRLENDVNPESHNSMDSENLPGSTCTSKSPPAQDWPVKLLAASIRDCPWLRSFLEKEPSEILKRKRSQMTDKRIRDIRFVEGTRCPKNEDKIFRGLAQRSLGLQFTRLQYEAQTKTRVDELCESICSADPEIRARIRKRTGFITRHLHRFKFAPEERGTLLRGINGGVKQLVVETLLQKRLEEAGRSNQSVAISAITALSIFAFGHLNFEDIPRFIDLIFLESSKTELPLNSVTTMPDHPRTEPFHILDIIASLSPFFSKFQDSYDRDVRSEEPSDLEQRSEMHKPKKLSPSKKNQIRMSVTWLHTTRRHTLQDLAALQLEMHYSAHLV
ncbi:uncharacterized protein ATNIH1004_002335 [Aspergillus tanneri]|uniref:Uncharacterized protein n=1 Tax=Aspergillus tanneri TaxID=1220188 RepID=A0A5M9MWB9_9EURO|nr:uncharacterized protein ATNIH1004_002335 [Aspergillus tanneri]KAA8649664.1 hypothetical protein ATNIH1004_002335 [Aspergillus tanneri]